MNEFITELKWSSEQSTEEWCTKMFEEKDSSVVTHYVYLESGVYVEMPVGTPEAKIKQEAANKFRQLFRQDATTIPMLIESEETGQ